MERAKVELNDPIFVQPESNCQPTEMLMTPLRRTGDASRLIQINARTAVVATLRPTQSTQPSS